MRPVWGCCARANELYSSREILSCILTAGFFGWLFMELRDEFSHILVDFFFSFLFFPLFSLLFSFFELLFNSFLNHCSCSRLWESNFAFRDACYILYIYMYVHYIVIFFFSFFFFLFFPLSLVYHFFFVPDFADRRLRRWLQFDEEGSLIPVNSPTESIRAPPKSDTQGNAVSCIFDEQIRQAKPNQNCPARSFKVRAYAFFVWHTSPHTHTHTC